MRIVTEPTPDGGWIAWDDDVFDGPGSAVGYGKTEKEAQRDLIEQLEDEE